MVIRRRARRELAADWRVPIWPAGSARGPRRFPLGGFALPATWTDRAQEATAGSGGELELGFLARDVYLVLGASGTLGVWVDGHHMQTIDVAPAASRAGSPGLRLHVRLRESGATWS